MPCNVFIVGHSFTRRLQSWCSTHNLLNLNLDPDRVQIFWHGEGGATVSKPHHSKSIWDTTHFITDLAIDITLIEIGSNDLCDSTLDPVTVSGYIIAYAESVLRKGCKVVVLSEILPRLAAYCYNDRVAFTNTVLKEYCASSSSVIFWSHSRQNFNRRFLADFVSADGVHIDPVRGMARYYSSVRGAILYAENRAQSF